ncbi:hypothetical protein [Anaerotignum sp.]|nr:hypothetical protein [Anaerotignum sp.]
MSEWLKDSLTSLRKIENKEVKNNKKSKFLKKVLTKGKSCGIIIFA